MNKKEILEIIDWWQMNYNYISSKETWGVCNTLPTREQITHPIDRTLLDYSVYLQYESRLLVTEALTLAENWGWIFDDKNIIIDFDMDKFEKRKHLIVGHEIGLL